MSWFAGPVANSEQLEFPRLAEVRVRFVFRGSPFAARRSRPGKEADFYRHAAEKPSFDLQNPSQDPLRSAASKPRIRPKKPDSGLPATMLGILPSLPPRTEPCQVQRAKAMLLERADRVPQGWCGFWDANAGFGVVLSVF